MAFNDALRTSILPGFLRLGQEGIGMVNRQAEETVSCLSCFLPGRYSMPPASGYPSAGCSPAEPASVSPDGNTYTNMDISCQLLPILHGFSYRFNRNPVFSQPLSGRDAPGGRIGQILFARYRHLPADLTDIVLFRLKSTMDWMIDAGLYPVVIIDLLDNPCSP